MKWLWTALLALIAVPTMAQAQTVTIARGEAVTLTHDDGGVWGVDREAAPSVTAFEAASAERMRREEQGMPTGSVAPAVPIYQSDTGTPAPVPQRGKVRLHFVRTPGADHSLLLIENGFDSGLVYRATMQIKGKTEATDVCLVIPGKVGLEHWPYAIDSLELSQIRLVMWKPGDRIPCE